MGKSITESAAEILAASLAGAGKEPMRAGGASVEDLGGETNTSAPSDIGAVASAKAKEAPKPGQAGAPAEPIKALGVKPPVAVDEKGVVTVEEVEEDDESDEDEIELTEKDLDEYLESLTEDELDALTAELNTLEEGSDGEEDEEEEDDDDDEEEDEEDEEEEPVVSDEEIAEARNAALKKMITDNMCSCKEDIDALFSGEELSEEFKTKATTIFEAAVRSRVEKIVKNVIEENETIIEDVTSEFQTNLTEQVDEYLNYVVEQWMEENKLAIESGLRVEIAEDFINGLKNLFMEHYMEVPEEKTDLVEQLADSVVEMEEQLTASGKARSDLVEELNKAKSKEILREVCEGLTSVQTEKIKTLAEGVEFTTEGEYSQKLAVIRESYFPTKKTKSESPQIIVETDGDGEITPTMDRYVKSITKQLPK